LSAQHAPVDPKEKDTKTTDITPPPDAQPAAKEPMAKAGIYLDPFTAKTPFDPGCPYQSIKLFELKSKTVKQIKPLVDDALMGFSTIVRVHNHLVWWEYYPSVKSPNGIWILRAQEKDDEPTLIIALHNVGESFYQWDGTTWRDLHVLADRTLPVVHIAGDVDNGVISLLGRIYLLDFKHL
jgi:hypothetical protein